MSGCHAATVTRCDSMADFGAYPYCGYSVAGKPFDAAHAAATGRATDYFYNSSLNPAANPRISTMPIISFNSIN